MKKRGGIIYLAILLSATLLITPAMGSIQQAEHYQNTEHSNTTEYVTLEFIDLTGKTPITKEITLLRTQWDEIRKELQDIPTDLTVQQTLDAQLTIFKTYQLISDDIAAETILQSSNEKTSAQRFSRLATKPSVAPIINNSVFNFMCGISFVLENGTNAVFGLNTFVNWVGFNIISVHVGNMTNGIVTNGPISRSAPSGRYAGVMFGFLGYWLGDKVSTGIYSNLTVAGFTVMTGWLPLPLFPQNN